MYSLNSKLLMLHLAVFPYSSVLCMQIDVETVQTNGSVEEADFLLNLATALLKTNANENYVLAMQHFKKITEQEFNKDAQAWAYVYLGKMHLLGYGIPKNEAMAHGYFTKALLIAEQTKGLENVELIVFLLAPDLFIIPVIDALKKPFDSGELCEELFELLSKCFYLKGQRRILCFAIAQGNRTAVRHMLEKKLIDPGFSEPLYLNDKHGRGALFSPFEIALAKDDIVLAKLLLTHNVSAMGSGRSALHHAAYYGSTECAEFLLTRGALFESLDSHNKTPLYLAAKAGRLTIVKLLIEKGAVVDPYNGTSWNSLVIGYQKTSSLFTRQDQTPLCIAVMKKHTDVAAFLLERGAQIRFDKNGRTFLLIAVENSDEKMAALLMKHGAYNKTEAKKLTFIALEKGCASILSLLLEKGISVHMVDEKGYSLLSRAVLLGHKALVELLIVRGANINVCDRVLDEAEIFREAFSGNSFFLMRLSLHKYPTLVLTPLQIAVDNNLLEMVQLLIEKGADLKNEGEKLIEAAQKKGFIDIEEYLKKALASSTQS